MIDGADEAALGQRLQAVIDRGEGDAGELALDAHEDFDGGGVIALDEEGVVNFATLGGETESLLRDRLTVWLGRGGVALRLGKHRVEISGGSGGLSRTILNKKWDWVSKRGGFDRYGVFLGLIWFD